MTLTTQRAPSAVALLGSRNFALLFGARIGSIIGDGFATVSVAFAVLRLTGSATALGAVLAARSLPYVLVVLGGGVWADRLPRRRVMIGADLCCMASQGVLAALLFSGHCRLWDILVLYMVMGTAQAFYRPAQQGIIPELLDVTELPKGNALLGLGYSIGEIAGPAAAGLVVAVTSPGVGIAVDAASFALGAALLALMRLAARERKPGSRGSFRRDFVEGFATVMQRTWLSTGIIYFSVFQFLTYGGLFVLGPLIAERHDGGASAWGLMLAGQGAGLALGSLIALRTSPKRLLWPMWLVVGFCSTPIFLLLAVPTSLPALVAGFVLFGVAIAYASIIWSIAMQQHVPQEALSRATSCDEMLSAALRPVGFIVFSPLAGLIGVATALTGSGLLILAGALALLAVPAVRGLTNTQSTGT